MGRLVVLLLPLLASCSISTVSRFVDPVVYKLKHWTFLPDKAEPNPVPVNARTVAEGRDLFSRNCAGCHGYDGQRTGIPFGNDSYPRVPDMASNDVQDYTDGQLKYIIEHGIWASGMPSWGKQLSDEDIWKIVAYVRNLPPKGTLGVPPMFEEGLDVARRPGGVPRDIGAEAGKHEVD